MYIACRLSKYFEYTEQMIEDHGTSRQVTVRPAISLLMFFSHVGITCVDFFFKHRYNADHLMIYPYIEIVSNFLLLCSKLPS